MYNTIDGVVVEQRLPFRLLLLCIMNYYTGQSVVAIKCSYAIQCPHHFFLLFVILFIEQDEQLIKTMEPIVV